MGGGINETLFVSLENDGHGVFKPKNEVGSDYHKRERAAYLIDRFLGFDLVPTTIIREIDGRVGSVQRFIKDAPGWLQLSEEDRNALSLLEKMKLNLFDFLILNGDRHGGNFLTKNGKIFAIDHGYSLMSHYDEADIFFDPRWTSTHIFPSTIIPIPLALRENLEALASSERKKATLKKLLLELLPQKDVDAFFVRLTVLIQTLESANWHYNHNEIVNQINSITQSY